LIRELHGALMKGVRGGRDRPGKFRDVQKLHRLIREGRLDEPVLYLSAYLERHRETYLDLMLAVSQKGMWLDWVRFFLKGLREPALGRP
jgi:hypothetical protein